MTFLGLRVDVDTHDGLRDGVPRLLDVLARHGVKATFYLSMGPDNSGRAVFNLLRPGFLAKMRRTSAASLYGWRTVLSGTLLPARMIGVALPAVARRVVAEGHEAGVHAWDHRTWQDSLLRRSPEWAARELDLGRAAFEKTLGTRPRTFAAPAWLSTEAALAHEETFGLDFASDCRGTEPFLPVIAGRPLATPQVPTTLPTLDEALGDTHTSAAGYFADMLRQSAVEPWPSLTIHAETEGGPYAADLDHFLAEAVRAGVRVVPLGALLAARKATAEPLPERAMTHRSVPGRHGVVFAPAQPA
jgi:undecaprenyl phosphate-alpha-L-ara4FN deformylase